MMIAAGFSYYTWQLVREVPEPEAPPRFDHWRMDYFLNNVRVVKYLPSGDLSYVLRAKSWRHNADLKQIDLVSPELIFCNPSKEWWLAKSERGDCDDKLQRVQLEKRVQLWRPPQQEMLAIKLRTDRCVVYPVKRYAETDADLSLSEAGNRLESQGAKIDFQSGTLEFNSRVNLWYKLNF